MTLAFFNFIFLGVEYLYDNMMAYVNDAEGVVLAESYILGASFWGFLLFPVLDKKITKSNKSIVSFIGALVGIICVFVIWQHGSYISILLCGCLLFVVLGIFGASVHYKISMVIEDKKHLAKSIGIAYAMGILLQFISNNLIVNDMIESIFLAVSLAVFVILLIKTEGYMPSNKENNINRREEEEDKGIKIKNPVVAEITIVGTVILMSCIFSTLNISVTYVHAGGSVDIGQ